MKAKRIPSRLTESSGNLTVSSIAGVSEVASAVTGGQTDGHDGSNSGFQVFLFYKEHFKQ
jgi:hypothetical protein